MFERCLKLLDPNRNVIRRGKNELGKSEYFHVTLLTQKLMKSYSFIVPAGNPV